ncbi:ABC transporter substrate-binding protein [Nocardia bhagyanarayanae]|uniref:NitT/TauT family transport system substrate-binding protein n=1 Tax=Nocardia bhagyanarayanae TaxID=1215925 RepID=A0A543FHB9_9NOCA|nr:ABC transporter substrate-binding protein [Nocardia bhagyanarayanae]TQM33215.1 NitT/TauT family transport system substrate-binding protein [Nocardia bhagyanarayanae]
MRSIRYRLGAVLAAVFALAATVTACGGGQASAPGTLRLGWVVDPCWSQVPVARDLGLFDKAGVRVEILPFPTGAAALEALAGGAVDIANGGDVPTAAAAIKNPALRVVADGARWDGGRFVARRSAGIDEIADLAGRRIAVPLGSSAHFFATRFLAEAGITAELVQTGPAEIVAAVSTGSVDAVAVFQPALAKVVAALGADAVELQGRDKYNQHSLYLATASTVESKSAEIKALLSALRLADAPLTNREPAALAAVAAATGLEQGLIGGVASEFEFRTELGPELAGDLADRARWAKSIGRIPVDATIPDYGALVAPGPLNGAANG